MSQHHVARCDGPSCAVETPLVPNYNRNDYTVMSNAPASSLPLPMSYSLPSKWLTAERREFCSWQCMSKFASAMADTGTAA